MIETIVAGLVVVALGHSIAVISQWFHMRERLKTVEVQAENDRKQLATYISKTDRLTDEIHELVVQMARSENRKARNQCDD